MRAALRGPGDRYSAADGEPLSPTPEDDFRLVLADLDACRSILTEHVSVMDRPMNREATGSMYDNLGNVRRRVKKLLDNHLQSM